MFNYSTNGKRYKASNCEATLPSPHPSLIRLSEPKSNYARTGEPPQTLTRIQVKALRLVTAAFNSDGSRFMYGLKENGAQKFYVIHTDGAAAFANFPGRELPVDMVPRVPTQILFFWVDGSTIFPKSLPGKWRRMGPVYRR
jgi:hypothetical protein